MASYHEIMQAFHRAHRVTVGDDDHEVVARYSGSLEQNQEQLTAGSWGGHAVTLADSDAYDAWALTTLGKPEEAWTGDMAEEGLAADAEGECFDILNDTPRPCAYSFMARVWFEEASRTEISRLLTEPERTAAPQADLTPCAIDVPLGRAIGRHVAGGVQIGLRTP